MGKKFIKDIAADVRIKTGFSQYWAEEAVIAVFDSIRESLKNGTEVQVAGFGKFYLEHRNARTGRNPHTGEAVPIPARLVPSFEAGKILKAMTMKEVE